MLDKSVSFKNIIMKIDSSNIPKSNNVLLPKGFSFSYFNNSEDIKYWSKIESSVLEFDSESKASEYFIQSYLPYISELQKRCTFVLNDKLIPVATATIWFADSELGHQVSLHWVAVSPEYQGLGIGKSIVQKALSISNSLNPNCDVWLHTQTWSYIAVKLYFKLGFRILQNAKLANNNTKNGVPKIYSNDYSDAISILKTKLDNRFIEQLVSLSK